MRRDGTSQIEHLARSIWLSGFSWGNCIAMIAKPHTAYFDASGKKEADVITVCGFVSDIKRWTAFDFEWEKALTSQSIDCFHMTDFVARRPPFDKIATDEKKRDQWFRKLVGIALRRTISSFAFMVPMRDYNSANRAYQLDEWFGGPYALAGFGCAVKLLRWSERTRIDQIEVFFEDGDDGKGELDRVLRDRLNIKPVFKGKKELRPFQAADLIAWECAKFIKTAQVPIEEYQFGLRQSLLALDSGDHDWGVAPREAIIQNCKNFSVPRRLNALPSKQ